MPRETSTTSRPIAVRFHEEDRSLASGLRFGTVEVLLAGAAAEKRGYLPQLGAEALARELGVPLLLDPSAAG